MANEVMATNKCYDIQENNINNICKNELIVKSEFVNLKQEPNGSICNNIETVYIKQEKTDEEMLSEEQQNELFDEYSADFTKVKCENQPVDLNFGSFTAENLKQTIDLKPHLVGHLNVNNVLTENRNTRQTNIISSTGDMSQFDYNTNIIITEEIDIKPECGDDGEYEESKAEQDTATETSASESDDSWESLDRNKRKHPTTKPSHLIRHTKINSGGKSFKCDQCNKIFTQLVSLITHKRVHSGEKPFKCDQCDKVFAQLSNLNTHKRVHSGVKPFKCDECDKVFAQSSSLHVHKRIHSGEKPFKCNLCEKFFTQLSNLNTHKRVHSGEKPFKCNQCDKVFAQQSTLNKHNRIHSENK